MAEFGAMVCERCAHTGPQLVVGTGARFVRELRRCRVCEGLASVLVATADPATGSWQQRTGRGRCRNELPWPPVEQRGQLDGPAVCGSSRLAALAPGDEGEQQPCPECGGVMRWQSAGIAD